jgi:replication factor A1
MYYCAKCNRIYDNCIYRYKLTLKVHDNTDFLWINAFSDTAEKILGMSAQELHHICEYEDEEFRYILSNLLNKSYSAVISLKNLDGRPQYTLEKVSERRDTQETAMSYVNEIKSLLNMRAF